MPTITIWSAIESSERLARRTLMSRVKAGWSATNTTVQTVSVAPATTVNLDPYTTYIFSADQLATVVIGWVVSTVTTEIPLNQLSILDPPATPYLRNTATTGNAVPVKVVAFS